MATPNKVAKRDAKSNHGMSQEQAGTLHFLPLVNLGTDRNFRLLIDDRCVSRLCHPGCRVPFTTMADCWKILFRACWTRYAHRQRNFWDPRLPSLRWYFVHWLPCWRFAVLFAFPLAWTCFAGFHCKRPLVKCRRPYVRQNKVMVTVRIFVRTTPAV